ncbi:MAG: LytR/AlgR family response regulator transcription factor [Wujia sp.]
MRILLADDESMVLEENKEVIEQIKPEAHIVCADNYVKALEAAEKEKIDVALLDIEMPGMNGLEISKRLKEINPETNIIFVTAYAEYALAAFGLYASGYLLKPIRAEAVKRAFSNLRYQPKYREDVLRVQCFGNFEVFYDGKPVQFARAKAKEIFAYLVDLKGAAANTGELCALLWEDSVESESNRHYLRNLIGDIKKALRGCNAEDVFISKRNQFAIVPEKIECDYYRYLARDIAAVNSYRGEYMKQYSWAEFSLSHIE